MSATLTKSVDSIGDIAKSLKSLLRDKGRAANKVVKEKAMSPDSAIRVLLDRALPNFDRNVAAVETPANSTGILLAHLLSSLKGSRGAATKAMKDSLREGKGAWPGATVGAGAGGVAGYDSDSDNKVADILQGALLGAGGGAAAGAGGTSLFRGGQAFGKHVGRRMRGWDALGSMGVMPRVLSDDAASAEQLVDAESLKDYWNVAKQIVREGDEGVVGMLTAGGGDAGGIFSGPFANAMRNAGIRKLDGGNIINPDLANAIRYPQVLAEMKKNIPGLQKFEGTVDGAKVLDIGNPARGTAQDLARLKLADRVRRETGSFVPRTRSDSLWDDLRNRKQNSYSLDTSWSEKIGPRDLVRKLSNKDVKATGLDRAQLQELLLRYQMPGNKNVRRIWDPKDTSGDYIPFSFDFSKDLSSRKEQLFPAVSLGRL